jgi:hypothetical protein
MTRFLIFLLGATISLALLAQFGFVVLVVCALTAWATLLFSTEPGEACESEGMTRLLLARTAR